jgi:5-methylcytosine-specific restriction protein A
MTGRAVPEWFGPRPETSPPPRVKARIVDRQGGKCATCNRKLGMCGEIIEFDHMIALILGGENRENNLQALCGICHISKTRADVAQKSTEARKRKKDLGLHRPRKKIPYRTADGALHWNGKERR